MSFFLQQNACVTYPLSTNNYMVTKRLNIPFCIPIQGLSTGLLIVS